MTDSSGNIVGQRGHYPFGEQWYAQNTTTKWLFTSYERDAESGNDYAMARYNVNRLGRFASPDLLAGSVGDPQSLDRYAYVLNDPVNLVDPLGLACGWWDMVTGGTPDCEDGGGYTVDGVPVDAQMAGWLLGTGAGAVCGSDCGAEAVSTRYCTSAGNCTALQTVIIAPDMRIWVPASTVSWNDSATGASGSSSEPGYWTTVGQLLAGPLGTGQGGAQPPPLLGFIPNFPPGMNPLYRATRRLPAARPGPEPTLMPVDEPPPELPVENQGMKRLLGLIAQFLSGLEGGVLRDFTLPFAVIPQGGYCAIDPSSCAVPSGTY